MVAATTSAIVFAMLYVMGVSTTVCSIVAFVAGAIPNWTLNRRWTWKVEGRVAFGREIVAYVIVSASTLVTLSLVTGWTHRHVQSIPAGHGIRVLLVTGSYFAVLAVLFGAAVLPLRALDLLGPQPRARGVAVAPPGVERGPREPHAVAEVPALLGRGRVLAAIAHRRRHLGQADSRSARR